MSYTIAVDIGGTQIRAALYPSDSLIPEKISKISTQAPGTTPLERLIDLILSIWPQDEKVAAIGMAAPGPLDPHRGIILAAPNIPGWQDLPLRQILEDRFHVPIALGNDANMAALAEWKYGAGQGHHYLIYLTVSTGIGGGVIMDDRLLLGSRGLATEMGHVTVQLDGPLCGCGQRGHLEAVASGTAITRWVEAEILQGVETTMPVNLPISGKMITEAAREGDDLAIAALARSGTFIGQALADFLHIFNPSAVIIGGGVSQCGHFLLEPMSEALKEHVLSPHYLDNLILTTAALGDDTGLMGALALARTSFKV